MYTLDENGYIVRPEGWDEATMGVSLNYWWGRRDELELRSADRDWEAIDALYAEYEKVKINYPYGRVVFDLSNIQMYLDNLSNVYNTYMPRIVFGMVDDPAAFVVEELDSIFETELKAAGIDLCMQEIQNQINAAYGL